MDQRNKKFCHFQTGYPILGQLNTVGATKQHSLFLSPFCSPCGWQHIYLLGFCAHKSFPSHIHFVRVQIPLQHPHVLLNTRDMTSTPDSTIIMIPSRYFAIFEMQMWPQLLCEAFWDPLMETPRNKQLTKVCPWPVPCMHRWLTVVRDQCHCPPATPLKLQARHTATSLPALFDFYPLSSWNIRELQVSRAIQRKLWFVKLIALILLLLFYKTTS